MPKLKLKIYARWLFFIGVSIISLAFFSFYIYGYRAYRVSGVSMSPTLHDKDIVLIDTSESHFKVGDVVLFEFNGATLKRISPFPDYLKTKPNEYFVLGDNRWQSHDSRYIGPISKDKIMGKAVYVLHLHHHRTALIQEL